MPEQWGIIQPIASAQNLPFIFPVILSGWQIPTGHHEEKRKKMPSISKSKMLLE
jgi:hypothetical protein